MASPTAAALGSPPPIRPMPHRDEGHGDTPLRVDEAARGSLDEPRRTAQTKTVSRSWNVCSCIGIAGLAIFGAIWLIVSNIIPCISWTIGRLCCCDLCCRDVAIFAREKDYKAP